MGTEQIQGMYRSIQLRLHTDILISQFQKYLTQNIYIYMRTWKILKLQKVVEVLITLG